MAKAKIKIDMKQINKFRFWIGLGVLALLLIVLSYFQLTAIGGEKEKKAYAEKLKSVKGLSDFKNDKFLPAWNAREEKLKTQRDEIWNKAWLPQKDMQTWFKRDDIWEKKYDTKSGKLVWSKFDPNIPEKLSMNANNEGNWRYPSEPIDGTTLDIYKDTLYLTQFHNFEKELVDARFPVEFNNGFDSLMAPITWKRGSTPTAEEVWLAQESFWVKREIIRDILKAIQSFFVPVVNYSYSPDKGCMPLEVTFNNNSQTISGSTYNWDFGNGELSNSITPVELYKDSGIFDVSLSITTPEGCTSSDTVINAITAYSTPVADFSYSPITPTIMLNPVYFEDKSVGLIDHWSWTLGDSLTTSIIPNPVQSFMVPGEYEIVLIVSNNYLCSDTIIKTVSVKNDFSFFIPKAFSPNDDGTNDLLEMYGFNFDKFDIKIYNRMGQLMKESISNPLWDGKDNNGNEMPEGVYVYSIKLREGLNNRPHEYQGTITLIR